MTCDFHSGCRWVGEFFFRDTSSGRVVNRWRLGETYCGLLFFFPFTNPCMQLYVTRSTHPPKYQLLRTPKHAPYIYLHQWHTIAAFGYSTIRVKAFQMSTNALDARVWCYTYWCTLLLTIFWIKYITALLKIKTKHFKIVKLFQWGGSPNFTAVYGRVHMCISYVCIQGDSLIVLHSLYILKKYSCYSETKFGIFKYTYTYVSFFKPLHLFFYFL